MTTPEKATWAAAALLAVIVLALWLAAIWTGDTRLTHTGWVLTIPTAVTAVAAATLSGRRIQNR